MSEDYKKIALEDVKKGQRVQIAFYHATHVASYTGTVVNIDSTWEWITLGYDLYDYRIYLNESETPDIFLLEDVPKPKVVRTETVTVTHYDDGTKTETETPVNEVRVPTVIWTLARFEEYEEYLKQVVLKDNDGDYWTYRDGKWRWTFSSLLPVITWHTPATQETFEESLPMTIVENVGD